MISNPRRELARALREKGLTYKEIGRQLGVTKTTAHDYCNPEKAAKKYARRNSKAYSETKHEPLTYFIEAVGLGRIKIGKTTNLTKRLRALQCGCPVELVILGVTDVSEYIIHRQFADKHHRNEWYVLDEEIVTYIEETCDGF